MKYARLVRIRYILVLALAFAAAGLHLEAGPLAQRAYIKASNTDAGDSFGSSVAVSGNTMVVGAPRERSKTNGVNGDENDDSIANAGAAYVYVSSGGVWTQQAYLKASNVGDDQFGCSVAISGDTLVIGARWEESSATGINGNDADDSATSAGAAYVFVRSGSTWTQQAYLKASNTAAYDQFGTSVGISGDTVVVGAPGEDSNGTGGQGDNSASMAGAVYVFHRIGGTWNQQAYLKASNIEANDGFGTSVAVDGDTVVVGAIGEDGNGAGGVSDNTASSAGAVYVFHRSGEAWSQEAYLKASNAQASDNFGVWVAISGDTLAVGAPYEDSNATGVGGNEADNSASSAGAAYVFTRTGDNWSQQAYLKASNTDAGDTFGTAVGLSGDTLVVGSPYEASNAAGIDANQTDNTLRMPGAAYIFSGNGSAWSQKAYVKASNPGDWDQFGMAAAASGVNVVVGAKGEASVATGIGGNQTDNTAAYAGAAYVFAGNEAPVANAGPDQTRECSSPTGTQVVLDGSGSLDPDNDVLSYVWRDSAGVIGTTEFLNMTLPLGTHNFTLTVDDAYGGADTDGVIVKVVDTGAPVVKLTLTPNVLWPPDRRMVEVIADVQTNDCAGKPKVALVSIKSNEKDSGLEPGDLPRDIQQANLGKDDRRFRLRAERYSKVPPNIITNEGRRYTITYEVTDQSGNKTRLSSVVRVPYSRPN